MQVEHCIEETLISVLSQQGDFELQYLIMDGGSTDQTLSVVKKTIAAWESAYPDQLAKTRIEVCSEPDTGMYDALSKGLAKAEGDIIGYINAGDYYLPGALSLIARVFQDYTQVNWVSGYRIKVGIWGNVLRSELPFSYRSSFITKGIYGRYLPFINQESTFFRGRLLREVPLDRLAAFKYAGDFYMWSCLASNNALYIVNAMIAVF